MPGKSFREQRVRAGIRANFADNFNVIYQESGLTSPAISCHCTNHQLDQSSGLPVMGGSEYFATNYYQGRVLQPSQEKTLGLKFWERN